MLLDDRISMSCAKRALQSTMKQYNVSLTKDNFEAVNLKSAFNSVCKKQNKPLLNLSKYSDEELNGLDFMATIL